MLAVCGDLNAKLSNNSRFSHHTETDDNGERLLDFCDEHQLVVSRNITTDSGLMSPLKNRGIKSTIFSGQKIGLTV